MYAEPSQRFPTIINRLDDYLWLLIFPYPLVADYSYQHFPYIDITSWEFWLSFIVNAGLIVLMVRLFNRRHPLAFALMFYFAFFMLINNVLFEVGATMGERLIYHSSLGFCMAVAWLLVKGLEKLPVGSEKEGTQPVAPKIILSAILVLLCIPAFMLTVQRNAEWENDFTLFTTDVEKHPNSALTNGNAGARYMDLGLKKLGVDTVIDGQPVKGYGRDTHTVRMYADKAIFYLSRATQIHKKYVNGWLNLGLCHYYKDEYELAAQSWSQAYAYFPSNPILRNYQQMLVGRANERAAMKDYAGAAEFLRYATITMPNDAKVWSDYAGASYMAKDFVTAQSAFEQAVRLTPDVNQQNGLRNGYNAAQHNELVLQAYRNDSNNVANINLLAQCYLGTTDFYPESRRLLNKALQVQPGNPRSEKLLDSLGTLERKAKVPLGK
jgi:tetratricopeptide (TPR) repeat protein